MATLACPDCGHSLFRASPWQASYETDGIPGRNLICMRCYPTPKLLPGDMTSRIKAWALHGLDPWFRGQRGIVSTLNQDKPEKREDRDDTLVHMDGI